jgi:hypothetical protein
MVRIAGKMLPPINRGQHDNDSETESAYRDGL